MRYLSQIAILVLVGLICQTIQVVQYDEDTSISQQMLERDPFIEIFQHAMNRPSEQKLYFFGFSLIDRSKTSANFKMNRLQAKIVKILKRYQIIKFKEELVSTKTQPEFISTKRKWKLQYIFAMKSDHETSEKCVKKFLRIGIFKLDNNRYIQYLSQKVQAMQTFKSAQRKINTILAQIRQLYIAQVQSIQILSNFYRNKPILENQIENEFSDSSEELDYKQLVQSQFKYNTSIKKPGMRIVFKIQKLSSNENSDDDDFESEDSEQYSEESSRES